MLALPILAWIPVITSTTLLIVYWLTDDLAPRAKTIAAMLFVVAVWLQFFAASSPWPTVGLTLQSLLAFALVLRLRLR